MDGTTATIDQFDVDGQIGDRMDDALGTADGTTRGEFLKKFAIGAGGIAVASALVAPGTAGAAQRRSERGDVEILQYALTLEYLEAEFYTQAERARGITGENKVFARVVGEHERAHVKALQDTLRSLGVTPVAKPTFDFQGTNRANGVFRKTALALEETGVAAYVGQAPYVLNEAILLAAARIATVEARHAAWMRALMGNPPAPNAFDGRRGKAETLRVVESTGFIVG